MLDSISLLTRLKSLDLLANASPWWWERALSFDVVIGAILTQNTKWENVERSLENLRTAGILVCTNSSRGESSEQSLQNLANCNSIESFIIPSGFYRQKSTRILALARDILAEFGSFERFGIEVSREWLLARKGIGFESADSILNYACGRAIMVVDSYSARLLGALGREMESYEDIQQWFMNLTTRDLAGLYGDLAYSEIGLAQIYARYHGKIVEFSKQKLPIQRLLDVDFGSFDK